MTKSVHISARVHDTEFDYYIDCPRSKKCLRHEEFTLFAQGQPGQGCQFDRTGGVCMHPEVIIKSLKTLQKHIAREIQWIRKDQ